VRFTPQDERFRADVRDWLDANLTGEFGSLRGAGGPGREHERHDEIQHDIIATRALGLPRS
jgi:hypothetical protein